MGQLRRPRQGDDGRDGAREYTLSAHGRQMVEARLDAARLEAPPRRPAAATALREETERMAAEPAPDSPSEPLPPVFMELAPKRAPRIGRYRIGKKH